MTFSPASRLAVAALAALAACAPAPPRERLVVGTTHTLEDSGLLEVLADAAADADVAFRMSAVVAGSGEILTLARNGDFDVVITHSPEDEQAFIASGAGEARHALMHNDFVIAGPISDPAGVAAAADAVESFMRIERARAAFVSRADDSGTHRREAALWAHAGILPDWSGYIAAGGGMADALRVAEQRRAYVLADRATWAALAPQLPGLRVLHEGDPRLLNQYSVIVVAGARNAAGAREFARWVRSPEVMQVIRAFGSAGGVPLFVPDTLR